MVINQGHFPGLIYMLPNLHDECTFLLWSEMENMDLNYMKIPKEMQEILEVTGSSAFAKIVSNFSSVVARR